MLKFSTEILARLKACERIFLGFSGGLDSTVLLHYLASFHPELAKKTHVLHVNHGLSSNALAWEKFCQEFCQALKLPIQVKRLELKILTNIEEEARQARYAFFSSILDKDSFLLLAHHQNDQAETLLLQLFRGAGLDGLAGMPMIRPLGLGFILRPWLHLERKDLESYAKEQGFAWIEDESNQDRRFSRNFLRHEVLPLLETRWPGVMKTLARTASHATEAQHLLQDLAFLEYPELRMPSLSLSRLKGLNKEHIHNLLRTFFKVQGVICPDTATFKRILPELILAKDGAQPLIAWGGYSLRRYQDTLYLLKDLAQPLVTELPWLDFPEDLNLGSGLGVLLAKKVTKGLVIPPGACISLKFRRGGERFHWHGQTKSLKKLMQDWKIPPWLRERIPLLYVDGILAVVIGYAIADSFYSASVSPAYELSLRGF